LVLLVLLILLILLALILVLLVLLILLILLLVLLILLLLLVLLDLLFDEVAVESGVGVLGVQPQRRLIGGHGLLPGLGRLLGIALLGLLAEAVEGVAEVVVGPFLEGELFGLERLLERAGGGGEVLVLIGGGAVVELKFRLLVLLVALRVFSVLLLGAGIVA